MHTAPTPRTTSTSPSTSIDFVRRRARGAAIAGALLAAASLPWAPPAADAVSASYAVTGRVSVATGGGQHVQQIGPRVRVDATGRFVAFSTTAPLGNEDTNGFADVYLRDRMGGTTTRVSLTDADSQINGPSQIWG